MERNPAENAALFPRRQRRSRMKKSQRTLH